MAAPCRCPRDEQGVRLKGNGSFFARSTRFSSGLFVAPATRMANIWTASSDAARQACGDAAARWGNAQAVTGWEVPLTQARSLSVDHHDATGSLSHGHGDRDDHCIQVRVNGHHDDWLGPGGPPRLESKHCDSTSGGPPAAAHWHVPGAGGLPGRARRTSAHRDRQAGRRLRLRARA
jgi:hypothetical protein